MNTIFLVLQLIALFILLVLSALFSGSETALFSLSAIQLQSFRNAGGFRARIVALLSNPAKVLSTILIGNTLVNTMIAAVGLSLLSSFDFFRPHAATWAILILTPLLLLFGELAPKRIAVRRPDAFTALIAAPVCFCFTLFSPLRFLLELFAARLKPLLRPERKSLSDEELLTAIELSAESGMLDSDERHMVDGIMQLSSMTAADVMTPRVDFVGIDLDEPEESYLAQIKSAEFHFLPVYENTPDAIQSFLDVRAYLLDPAHNFERATRKPIYVPETATLDDILITMQRSRRHIVCIMDEYGGTAGLVTRSDILEILTGVIPSFEEKPEEDIVKSDRPDSWIIDGDTSLEEINHALNLELEAEGADRISGWILAQAGRFVRTGESVEAQNCRVRVLKHKKLRILSVELEILPPAANEVDESITDPLDTEQDADEQEVAE